MDNDLLWKSEKRKHECDMLDKDSEGEEENKEDFYAGKWISSFLKLIS